MPYEIEVLFDAFSNQVERNYANNIMHLTALSLLLDKGIVTVEDIARRTEEVQSVLPERYQTEGVTKRTALVVDALRNVYGQKLPRWTPEVIQGGLDQDQDDDPSRPNDPKKDA